MKIVCACTSTKWQQTHTGYQFRIKHQRNIAHFWKCFATPAHTLQTSLFNYSSERCCCGKTSIQTASKKN